jgi:DNA modification methylase
MIINGNNIEELKKFDDNYFDSIVTDPPYEIGFMGKSWDASGIANNPEMWSECLRVLKPGGYLLSFSATRTYHRMAVAIEDSGFEIRDMIEWVYGSGFPKSLNIGKAVDKLGVNPYGWIEFSKAYKNIVEESKYNHNDIDKYLGIKASSCYWARTDHRGGLPPRHHWEKIKEFIGLDSRYDELYNEVEREIFGEKKVMGKDTDLIYGKYKGGIVYITKGTSEWEGWGTALKPAHEPICMARKPLAEKTVAENVLKYGTGGINIDESRVGTGREKAQKQGVSNSLTQVAGRDESSLKDYPLDLGRFPANLIHDNSEEVRECFPESSKGWGKATNSETSGDKSMFGIGGVNANRYDMGGESSARFFKSIIYQAKASKSERGVGNIHPTVKPVALMEYLIKMVTPTNGIVLDPFMGSGSTGVACVLNNFEFVGIDLDKDYCEIARARIEGVKETQTKMF